jgi:hypothetical protein
MTMRDSIVTRGHARYVEIELGGIARVYSEAYMWDRR